jgi:hypothetical protein
MDTKKTQAPKPATKTPGAAGTVAKDATKHIVKGMKEVDTESHATMADENSLPKTGGESVKNAATKHVKSGLKGGDLKSQKTQPAPAVKKPGLKEDEVISNAANKHILNGIKAGEGHTVNMVKTTTISNPGEEKMAKPTSGTATKQETRAPKPKEQQFDQAKTGGKDKPQETVVPKPKEKHFDQANKATSTPKSTSAPKTTSTPKSTSAPKTTSAPAPKSTPKPTETKEKKEDDKEDVTESELALRGGANGKVYEQNNLPNDESWVDESWNVAEGDGEECWMNEDDDNVEAGESEEEDKATKALNEQIARMKQILRY